MQLLSILQVVYCRFIKDVSCKPTHLQPPPGFKTDWHHALLPGEMFSFSRLLGFKQIGIALLPSEMFSSSLMSPYFIRST